MARLSAVHNIHALDVCIRYVKSHGFFITSTWCVHRTKYVKLLAAATKGDLRGGKQQNGAKTADDWKAGQADAMEEAAEAEDKTEKQEQTRDDAQEQAEAGE